MMTARPIPLRGDPAGSPANGTRGNGLDPGAERILPARVVPEDAGFPSSQCYNAISWDTES